MNDRLTFCMHYHNKDKVKNMKQCVIKYLFCLRRQVFYENIA